MIEPNDYSISLCMIVKDEEEHITRCLTSVRDYVDEIIVLDTGSTDSTPLRARALGATVIHAAWEDDFARARNQSKEPARGGWILVLDADEEMPPETARTLRRLAENPHVEAYTFTIVNHTSTSQDSPKLSGLNVRMFRNNPAYQFEGAVHEQIKPCILRTNPGAIIEHSGLAILHYGYCSDSAHRKAKTLRNIAILKKMLALNPADGFAHYNLAVSYYVNGQLAAAKAHYQLSKQHLSSGPGYQPALYRNFAICLNDLGEYEEALNLLEEGIACFPDYPDLYYLQGQILATLYLYAEAEKSFAQCLKFVKVNPDYISMPGVESFLAHEQLADVYCHLQDWNRALDEQLLAIRAGADSFKSALRLALIARKTLRSREEVTDFLQTALSRPDVEEVVGLAFAQELGMDYASEPDGIPLVQQQLSRFQPSPQGYTGLLEAMARAFEQSLRQIMSTYPGFAPVRHHLFSLATFRAKLSGKEGIYCQSP